MHALVLVVAPSPNPTTPYSNRIAIPSHTLIASPTPTLSHTLLLLLLSLRLHLHKRELLLLSLLRHLLLPQLLRLRLLRLPPTRLHFRPRLRLRYTNAYAYNSYAYSES